MSLITLCPATTRDVDALVANLQAGFDSYRDFAPLGWVPPDVTRERERILETLEDSGTWALLALSDEQPVGHVSFFPAREREPGESLRDWRARPMIPGAAHLWQLFVLPAWWGSGVAPLLHDAAITEMRARRFSHARLYTPTLHGRARRFYERRGWHEAADVVDSPLGLGITEYRLDLTDPMVPSARRRHPDGGHRR